MIRISVFDEQTPFNKYHGFETMEQIKQQCHEYHKSLMFLRKGKDLQSIQIMKSLVQANPKNDIYRQLYANILRWDLNNPTLIKQGSHQRKITYKLNPNSIYNFLLYATSIANYISGKDLKSRKLLKKALKKTNYIRLGPSGNIQHVPLTQRVTSSNAIHMELAWHYSHQHPFNLREAYKHCLMSSQTVGNIKNVFLYPIVLIKTLLLIGKYSHGGAVCNALQSFNCKPKLVQFTDCIGNPNDFELQKVHGHFLLNMETYQDAMKQFTCAQLAAVNSEQKLECCTAFVLCYSHLGQFAEAEKWFNKGKKLWNS
eukprot:298245_1